MKLLIVPALLLAACSTAWSQSSPPAPGVFTPPGQAPAEPKPDPATGPQTPGGGAPAGFTPPGEKQRFPGPRGTTFTFPTGLYDEATPGMTIVLQAAEKARKQNKRVLITLGENMCGFCVFLNDLVTNDPTVKNIVNSEFVLAKINIGKSFRENADVQGKYGIDFFKTAPDGRGVGAPAMAVIDPDTDRGVAFIGGNAMVASPMTMDRVFDEKKVAEFLVAHQAPAKPAQPVLDAALASAKKDGRSALLLFVAPGNDPSAKLESWLHRPDVAPILAKHFALATIDTERMIGGKDALAKITGDKTAIAPLLTLADAEAKPLSDASTFKAAPRTDEQIKAFVDALAAAAPKLSADERATLSKALASAWDEPAKK